MSDNFNSNNLKIIEYPVQPKIGGQKILQVLAHDPLAFAAVVIFLMQTLNVRILFKNCIQISPQDRVSKKPSRFLRENVAFNEFGFYYIAVKRKYTHPPHKICEKPIVTREYFVTPGHFKSFPISPSHPLDTRKFELFHWRYHTHVCCLVSILRIGFGLPPPPFFHTPYW